MIELLLYVLAIITGFSIAFIIIYIIELVPIIYRRIKNRFNKPKSFINSNSSFNYISSAPFTLIKPTIK